MSTIQQKPLQQSAVSEKEVPDWFYFVFGMMLVIFSSFEVQGQNLSFNNSVPDGIMVCEGEESFTVEFTNTSGGSISNVEVLLNLPTGVEYVSGSLSEASTFNVQESDISDLSAVIFSANSLTSGGTITFSFDATANFSAYTNQLGGNIFSNHVTVNYTGESESDLTDAYNILYPALSITNVDPMSATVFVGGTYTRNVTIVNGGYGSVSTFVLKNIYDSNLTLDGVNVGTLNANKDEITFTSADFLAFGNGDGFLDQNESMVFTQTLTAVGCTSTQDEMTAYWGCDGEVSPSNTKFPFTTINLFPPSLSITPTSTFGTCVDGADNQQLAVTNNGSGPANATQVKIFPYTYNQYTRVDPTSISYTLNGTEVSLTPIATQDATGYDCLGSNPVDGFTVSLPAIQPGETLYLNWDNYTCATISCARVHYVGWQYEGEYTDMCNSKIYEFEGVGQANKIKGMSTFYESPSDLADGQKGTYTLNINSATFSMPQGTSPYFEAVFNVPVGLVWSGVATDLEYVSGQSSWTADQVNYDNSTRVLTAQYDLPIPSGFSLNHSQFNLDLVADCTPGVSWVAVGMQLFHIMDTNCTTPYRVAMTCKEVPETQLHCPGPCAHGLAFKSFDIARTSFGKSDNDLDGLPDATSSLNMNLVKAGRVMVSDTFETTFTGEVLTSATFPSWEYGYAQSKVPHGDKIQVLSARVDIVDKSTGLTISCNNVPYAESLSGGIRTVDFDFSASTLSALGCSDFTGFQMEDEDEITLVATYKMVGNIGGNAEQVMITNDFYVSDTANGTAYQCNDWNGNFTIIGYYFTTWKSNQFNAESCTETIYQNYYMSIGDCCTNFSGGNLFPYEYRNWSNIKSIRVEIPDGYSYVSGSVEQWRTKTTNASILESTNITPTSISGTTHIFDMTAYHVENGGALNFSDDGYNGRISIEVKPECDVNQAANLPVNYFFTFQENSALGGNVTSEYSGNTDYIKYYRANVKPSSTLPTQEGISSTVTWDLKIKNTKANATNSWFHLEDLSGNIVIEEVKNISDNSVVTAVNGFYQLGNMTDGQIENFQITASYNSCDLSALKVVSGFDCDGYPTTLSNYECGTEELILQIAPQPSELQVRFNSYTNPLDDCDNSITVEFEMLSSKLAAVEDLFINVIQPSTQTVTIETGSVEVLYPLSGSYTTLTDPALVGETYTVNGSDMSSTIGSNGLVGVTDVSSNMVRLKMNLLLDNDYKPGEIINFEIGGKRPCGTDLPTLALAYDPNASFKKPENIGLGEVSDAWAAAWGDYDNDGNVDLFVTNYSANTANILYHNNGDASFTKVTTGAIATDMASSLAASWGDYDNDGDLDLYVANNIGSENFLYRNDGGTFTRILNDPIVTDKGYAHGVSWVDYDNDGYLDMFVTDYFSTRFNQLYRNNGDGTFAKANGTAPTLEAGFSVSGSWGDFNSDGLPDLFVCNTEGNNNSLYKNTGNGNFLKINTGDIVNDGANSVGASWGDYDNDGDLDLFVANSGEQNNFLYQNNGDETFTKITSGNIVTDGGHSHGSAWADYDNDGDLDLFVSNDQDQNNFLYANNGNGTFTSITNDITQDEGQSFGAAWADYDNDGDVDLFVANHKLNENFIYQNSRGKCQSKACVILVGSNTNRSAVGTKVRVKANIYGQSVWQMREISSQSGGGIGGQNELKTIFGLGDASTIDSMIVEWNSGYRQVLTNLTPSDCFTITEENASEVCGVIFYDKNNNCTQDTDEPGIPNMKVMLQPGDISTVTNGNGAYSILAAPGQYTIEQEATGTNWNPTCTTRLSVDVTGIGGQFCGNNFADTASCALPDLQVELSASAHRVGFENLIALTYRNVGAQTATNAKLTVMFGQYIIPMESSIPWTLEAGTDRRWDLGDIEIGESVTIYIKDSVSTAVTIGDDIQLKASFYANEDDCDGLDNIVMDTQPAVGAIDPNDIAVSPEGHIENDQELIYKIRFQNIGNATVSTVRIEDRLPEGLDLNTLQVGLASHNYRFEIEDENRLVWTFDNIDMPDSLTNEPESHGFVIFKIQPKVGLADGETLENNALIFFDNVDPLKTNTVVNIIGRAPNTAVEAGQLHIFPNPMTDQSSIQIIPFEAGDVDIVSVTVFDLLGEKLFEKVGLASDAFELKRGELPTGYFIIKAVGENGKNYSGKILIK